MVRTIKVDSYDDRWVWRLSKGLEDPDFILTVLGDYLEEKSIDAFEFQEYDGEPWLPRYPNQEEAKLNIAGVIQDLNETDTIKPSRFTDSPALIDTGDLANATYVRRVGNDSIEVGNDMPYAADMNYGGERTQPVTEDAKDRILHFMKSPEGQDYYFQLSWVLQEDEHKTDVIPRPFMGITPGMREEMVDLVEEALEYITDGDT